MYGLLFFCRCGRKNGSQTCYNNEKDVLLYTIVTHKLETVEISAEAEDPNATVEIKKPEKLEIGTNKVYVTVTSEKGDKKEYVVEINNLDTDIDTSLKNIELFNCDESLNFETGKYDYELTYKSKYTESLVIKPIVNNNDEAVATLDKDLTNLKPGEKITITVSAKDGTRNVESYYTITFKKDNRINFFLILSVSG